MTIETLLRAMHRMPWRHVASKAIHISGGRPRRGWHNTEEAAATGGLEGVSIQELERLYSEHLLVGEKFSKFYPLDDASEALRNAFTTIEVEQSDFRDAYPFPLDGEELKDAEDELKIVSVEQTDDGIGVVLCSKLTISKREEISIQDWLPDGDSKDEFLRSFSEIYGLKIERTQLFHVVWLPSDLDIIDIRVDFPDGMHEDVAHRLHAAIRDKISEEIGMSLPATPIDFMPAISSIYEEKGEGNVVEFGFITITNSVKNERMRQARGGFTCLRDELFHKAGIEALMKTSLDGEAPSPITPFRISVQWPVPADENIYISPELTLASTTRGGGTGRITGVAMRNCLESAQYNFIRDKLLKHMGI
ncbi:hypothetical protein [Maritimibacter alkaliphilus]|uniref:hypothetical protein n=1 Tax=Maritimibacter alkaliphilus TaxID=404236 RepID=UPI001C960553|nr:hypothetical protein [Maritimibacter alkaliphilus]MBY6088961.1 hypothetical protein [Maritimibacter alkaliphilus]